MPEYNRFHKINKTYLLDYNFDYKKTISLIGTTKSKTEYYKIKFKGKLKKIIENGNDFTFEVKIINFHLLNHNLVLMNQGSSFKIIINDLKQKFEIKEKEYNSRFLISILNKMFNFRKEINKLNAYYNIKHIPKNGYSWRLNKQLILKTLKQLGYDPLNIKISGNAKYLGQNKENYKFIRTLNYSIIQNNSKYFKLFKMKRKFISYDSIPKNKNMLLNRKFEAKNIKEIIDFENRKYKIIEDFIGSFQYTF